MASDESDDEWFQRTPGYDPEKFGYELKQELARLYGKEFRDKKYDGVRQQDQVDIEYYHLEIDDESAAHQKNMISNLRVLSQFLDKPIRENSAKKLNVKLKSLERERGWQTDPPSSRSRYATALSAFLRAHEDIEKAEKIKIPKIEPDDIDPDEVIDWADDLMPMIQDGCTNPRDRALISTLWEASNRISAHCALKIKHYDPYDDYALLTIPKDMNEGDKDAGGDVKPLIISRGYVDNWLADHPCPDDPEASLFCKVVSYRELDDEGDHISPQRVRDLMYEAAERADIDEEKLKRAKPHEMRHSRASYMRASDKYGKDDIETLMDWSDKTIQHDRYEHVEAEQEANRILRKQGIETEETEEETIEIECPRCGYTTPKHERYCLKCSLRLDDSPAEWYAIFKDIIANPDDDPIVQKYDDITSATPEYSDLPKSEFEHVKKMLLAASLISDYGDKYNIGVEDDIDASGLDEDKVDHIYETYIHNSDQLLDNFVLNRTEYDLAGETEFETSIEELEHDLRKREEE